MAIVDFGERLAARQTQSDTLVQDLAAELGSGAAAIAAALTVDLLAAEQRLVDPEDPRLATLAHRFAASTVGAMLSALAFGMPTAAARPTEASMALFERLAERDDGLAVALRAHRLLASDLWQVWAVFVGDRVRDRNAHQATLIASTRQLDGYVDAVSEQLAEAWPEARKRRRRGLGVPAEELVGRAVGGSEAAARAALAQLGFPLEATYVAVALPPSLERETLEGLARRVQLACAASTLASAEGEERTLWVAFTRAEEAQRPERIRPLAELAGPLGAGDAGAGIAGFRRTREQARDALRVATLADKTGLTLHRDVALLAVLWADETRARDLARVELGPLAGDDELAVRLRETIAAYLAAGESQVAAAQRLFVHEKTVKYRLRQAEELLGCKIGERRDELSAALMAHRAFGVTT